MVTSINLNPSNPRWREFMVFCPNNINNYFCRWMQKNSSKEYAEENKTPFNVCKFSFSVISCSML